MVSGQCDTRQAAATEVFENGDESIEAKETARLKSEIRATRPAASTSNTSEHHLMPIKESDIEKVAQLAHLELAPEELKVFGPQIVEIVSYVEQLNELDTTNVEPAIGGFTPEGAATNSERNDQLVPSLGQQTALAEAPDAAAGHFRVPKVL